MSRERLHGVQGDLFFPFAEGDRVAYCGDRRRKIAKRLQNGHTLRVLKLTEEKDGTQHVKIGHYDHRNSLLNRYWLPAGQFKKIEEQHE